MTETCRRLATRAAAPLAALLLVGCAHTEHLAVSHRHSPGSEARIVIFPIGLPADQEHLPGEGRTLAGLYATELLKSYEVLEYDRFEQTLSRLGLSIEKVLTDGLPSENASEVGVDALLLSEVYEWDTGKAGFWFLKKKGRIGFQARLVDLGTGNVIWGINRVMETTPAQPLSVGLSVVFAELVDEMPRNLTPF